MVPFFSRSRSLTQFLEYYCDVVQAKFFKVCLKCCFHCIIQWLKTENEILNIFIVNRDNLSSSLFELQQQMPKSKQIHLVYVQYLVISHWLMQQNLWFSLLNSSKSRLVVRLSSKVPTNPITITRIFPHWPMEQI